MERRLVGQSNWSIAGTLSLRPRENPVPLRNRISALTNWVSAQKNQTVRIMGLSDYPKLLPFSLKTRQSGGGMVTNQELVQPHEVDFYSCPAVASLRIRFADGSGWGWSILRKRNNKVWSNHETVFLRRCSPIFRRISSEVKFDPRDRIIRESNKILVLRQHNQTKKQFTELSLKSLAKAS
jgi:hypothetical protein